MKVVESSPADRATALTSLHRRFSASTLLLALVAAAALIGGCAPVVKEAAREAAPVGVQSSLSELAKPESQATIGQIADAPGVRRVGTAVGEGVGQGIVDRLTSIVLDMLDIAPPATQPAAAGQSETRRSTTRPITTRPAGGWAGKLLSDASGPASELSATVAGAVSREAVRAAREELGPAAAVIIREQIGPAIAQTLREQIVPAIGAAVREQLKPVVQQSLREDAGPAIREIARQAASGAVDGILEERKQTLELASRHLAKGAALGARDAVAEANIPIPADPFHEVSKTFEHFVWLATGLLAVAGVLALGILAGLAILGYAVWKGRRPAASKQVPA